jgi:Putative peptidoglycan binding domain/CHAP domain
MPAELHVTSPLMHSEEIKQLQQRLQALGYNPGPVDGQYGVATSNAVKAFQKARHLQVDGVIGKDTRKALLSAKAQQVVKDVGKRRAMTPGQKALAEAAKYLGVKESPIGSNKTQFGKWFGVDGVAWCNIFVSYCFVHGAGKVIAKGFKGAGCYPNGCTYVPTTEAWLRATGQWIGRAEPQPGDIAIFNWDGGVPDHIGIVEVYLGGGNFRSIEGNTAVGNDSNGGEVMRRDRKLSQVDGFGRVR